MARHRSVRIICHMQMLFRNNVNGRRKRAIVSSTIVATFIFILRIHHRAMTDGGGQERRGSRSCQVDAFLCWWRIQMRKLIMSMALLALIGAPAAMAQTGSKTGTSGAANQQPQPMREAPIGHRQPRADDVPSEKNLSNPNDPVNREDAALDRKIKSICRGC